MILNEQYHELAFYTLSLGDKQFIHQHLVDAYSAQMATNTTKPITILFALAGLYLMVEKGYTGKQVQLAHIQMAKRYTTPVNIALPKERGSLTISDVLAIAPGKDRDAMIVQWCVSVWAAYKQVHPIIIETTHQLLGSVL
jgi:hypothetical protein